MFSVCWVTALRYTPLSRRALALFGMIIILVINITEAVALDLFGGHLDHYYVMIAGILVIMTLPRSRHAISVGAGNRNCDLHYEGMTRIWIVGYTLWNWAFVYLNYPIVAGQHLAVLASAFVVGMIEPRRWLQARAYTLATYVFVLATFRDFQTSWMDTSHWTNPFARIVVAATCLGIVVISTARDIVGRVLESINSLSPCQSLPLGPHATGPAAAGVGG